MLEQQAVAASKHQVAGVSSVTAGAAHRHPAFVPFSSTKDPVSVASLRTAACTADYVKYSFPMATSMTMLAWSLVEFSKGYAAAGALNSATSQLKWGADYLIRAHTTPSSFVVQVGALADLQRCRCDTVLSGSILCGS
jgi:hypothetical protein